MQRAHERDVFAVAMVVVTGDVAVRVVSDLAGCVSETVPDGFAFAVFVPCAFDLVRGRGGAPVEAFREIDRRCGGVRSAGQKRRDGGCSEGPEKLAAGSQVGPRSRSYAPLDSRERLSLRELIMLDKRAVFLAG
jgi:hypothetical protein